MAKNVWEVNYAKNASIRERVEQMIIPKIQEAQDQRQEMELDWERFVKMFHVEKDDEHQYRGRSNLYIPEVRKNVEAQTRQLVEGAFPASNENFFDVTPDMYSGTKKGADMQKQMRKFQIMQCGLRTKYHQFTRQKVLLGTSVARTEWRRDERMTFRRILKGNKVQTAREKFVCYNGPDFIPVDMFKWYVMDAMKSDWQKYGCFEHSVVNQNDVRAEDKKGYIHDVDAVLQGATTETSIDELDADIERMENQGIMMTAGASAGVADLRDYKKEGKFLRTVVYCLLPLKEAMEDGDECEWLPVEIVIYNKTHVALVRRNPFYDQQAPYVMDTYMLPDAGLGPYGEGIPHAIQYMQYEINSKQEQSMDSATLALNPIIFADPGMAGNKASFEIEPGAIWNISPQGVKFGQIPDTTLTGYQAISQLRTQIADFSDRAPALAPQLSGKARSATQAEYVERTISIDLRSFIMNAELKVLQPVMEKWEMLTDQNLEEDEVIMTLGPRSGKWARTFVSRESLIGRYRYFWRVASTMQNKQILSRQMLDLLKVMASVPPQMLGNTKVDVGEILRMVWKEGWELPDAHRVFSGDQLFGQPQDPDIENKMCALGLELEVMPDDDDATHMTIHDQHLGKTKDRETKAALIGHIKNHSTSRQLKAQLAQQAQQAMMMAQQQAAQQAQPEGPRKSVGSGNRTQLSPNLTKGNMGSGVRA